MRKIISFAVICLTLSILSSCTGNGGGNGEQANYDETKKMVTDILKTDDGKKAITEILSDEEIQKKVVIESKVVEDAVSKQLTSEEGKDFWKKMFDDPKFVESFAKMIQKQQEDVTKGLMSDSEYQKKMIEILQNPEMEEQVLSVLTGQKFREHLEKTIQETMDSPMFKAKMTDVILKAAEEMKPSGEGGGGEKSGSGGSSEGGGESGGGSGESEGS
ncbi:spore germination lipoprotein GerD [Aquibacillus saliphilus]|uniref:spore germination lipoprotein GerD n=1 Tax=Aquibacillus saliphilus TaxID=1909422 RepID=UPI001CF0B07C|nr:spore germination lipoprotein GerD [Aquibacillus saliphilus]